MERGKFIVFEGIDGSGKSTQVKAISDLLIKSGRKVHVTRECTDNPIGLLLRNVYLPGKRKCDERVINMLYAADRLDHITNEENGMLHILNSGIDVISDRYYLSSFAYDTYSYVASPDYEEHMTDILLRNKVNMDILKPDITIYIDTSPMVAMERLEHNRSETTVYERIEKLELIYKAYQRAIYRCREFGETIVDISGEKKPEYVTIAILSVLNSVLNIEIDGGD